MGSDFEGKTMKLGFRNGMNLPNSVDYEAIKKNAFHDQSLLIINLDDPSLNWVERQMLSQVGEKFYGKRKKTEM